VVWFGCIPDGGVGFGCEIEQDSNIDLGADPEDMPPEERQEWQASLAASGFLGMEPGPPPSWDIPTDVLDGLSEIEKAEGVNGLLTITVLGETEPSDTSSLAGDTGATDTSSDLANESTPEIALKRLQISESSTPNHNPDITGFQIGNLPVVNGGGVSLPPNSTITISPVLSPTSIEEYTFLTVNGSSESRTEEPYVTWYIDNGSIDHPYGLHPHIDVDFTAPDESTTGTIIAVVRDRRGGMSWATLHFSTEQ